MGLSAQDNPIPIPIPAFPLKGKEQMPFHLRLRQMENLG
jgi:hypothetical protein